MERPLSHSGLWGRSQLTRRNIWRQTTVHTQPAKTSSQRLWFGKTRSMMMTNAELKPTSSIFRSRRSCWGHGRLIKDHNLHRWSLEPAKKTFLQPPVCSAEGPSQQRFHAARPDVKVKIRTATQTNTQRNLGYCLFRRRRLEGGVDGEPP